jgi:hypothetical protein
MSVPSDRVVFVDDEEEVRRANGQSLDLAGFSVETHASCRAENSPSPSRPGRRTSVTTTPGGSARTARRAD